MKTVFFLLLSVSFVFVAIAQQPFFPTANPETGLWDFLNPKGEIVLQLKDQNIVDVRPFSEGFAAAKDASKQLWGFIDQKGTWKIKPQYNSVQDFVGGYAIVSKTCSKDCYEGEEGLLNTDNSYIINPKNEVLYTDRAQDRNPKSRFFLDKNLGGGLFRITFGYGLADMKTVVNLQGKVSCDVYSVFGRGDIEYDPDLNIFKCWNKFYKPSGELVLDLDKYTFVGMFANGYLWAYEEEIINEETSKGWHILIDSKGKEIGRFSETDYVDVSEVEAGKFIYSTSDYATMQYDLATQTSNLYEDPLQLDFTMEAGSKLKNGTRLIYDGNKELIGFVTTEGELVFKSQK